MSEEASEYAIFVNNVYIESVTGLSYFYECIPPGAKTSFDVVALDGDGDFLGVESLTIQDDTVSLGGSPWDAPDSCTEILDQIRDADPVGESLDDDIPEAQAFELRVETYSPGVYEVFWPRISGIGIYYEVLTDDTQVVTDGTSQFYAGTVITNITVTAFDARGHLVGFGFRALP